MYRKSELGRGTSEWKSVVTERPPKQLVTQAGTIIMRSRWANRYEWWRTRRFSRSFLRHFEHAALWWSEKPFTCRGDILRLVFLPVSWGWIWRFVSSFLSFLHYVSDNQNRDKMSPSGGRLISSLECVLIHLFRTRIVWVGGKFFEIYRNVVLFDLEGRWEINRWGVGVRVGWINCITEKASGWWQIMRYILHVEPRRLLDIFTGL